MHCAGRRPRLRRRLPPRRRSPLRFSLRPKNRPCPPESASGRRVSPTGRQPVRPFQASHHLHRQRPNQHRRRPRLLRFKPIRHSQFRSRQLHPNLSFLHPNPRRFHRSRPRQLRSNQAQPQTLHRNPFNQRRQLKRRPSRPQLKSHLLKRRTRRSTLNPFALRQTDRHLLRRHQLPWPVGCP